MTVKLLHSVNQKAATGHPRGGAHPLHPPPRSAPEDHIFCLSHHVTHLSSYFVDSSPAQPALQLAHTLVKTICIVHLQISAQKLVLISYRVVRTYVSVSDRRFRASTTQATPYPPTLTAPSKSHDNLVSDLDVKQCEPSPLQKS